MRMFSVVSVLHSVQGEGEISYNDYPLTLIMFKLIHYEEHTVPKWSVCILSFYNSKFAYICY